MLNPPTAAHLSLALCGLEMALTSRTAEGRLSGNCGKQRAGPASSVLLRVNLWKMLFAVHPNHPQVALQDGKRELRFRCADR